MKLKIILTVFIASILGQLYGQITYEIDSSNFKYVNADDKILLQGGNQLASEVTFRVRETDTSGYVQIKSQLNPSINIFAQDGGQNIQISSKFNESGGAILLSDEANGRDDVIRLVTNFQNSGDARVFTDEIQINGGSDLAEMFDITNERAEITPGLLVSLDPKSPGKLKISDTPYDKKIAGILSGANGVKPGILMGQDNTIAHGDDLVTLSGRTYVMANTSNGSIQVGDFITTSSIQGQAMKATSKRKSRGAVIGKAMTNLERGTGYILVLVNLQ